LSAESLRAFVAHEEARDVAIVADVMSPPLTFNERDDIRNAAVALVKRDLRAAPVLDDAGRVVGLLDQHDIVAALTAPPATELSRDSRSMTIPPSLSTTVPPTPVPKPPPK
jgi:predicted transcriptional regulator